MAGQPDHDANVHSIASIELGLDSCANGGTSWKCIANASLFVAAKPGLCCDRPCGNECSPALTSPPRALLVDNPITACSRPQQRPR